MVSNAPTSLAPGFRFHPTDEELVRYYLRRKICGKPFRLDAISEVDIYKTEPWDLPGMSKLKTRDLEWYFFSFLDKKYGNGSRTNRATEKGYWKTTGKDRSVFHRSKVVGMKKTLVYHFGRAPRGQRTNWVMHEYRLMDEALDKAGFVQDSFVLCRVFQKSGPGPKNGEQYGAPLIEEEWEDDEFELFLKEEAKIEMEVGDDAYLDEDDIDQILGAEDKHEDAPLRLEQYPGEGDLFVGGNTESVDDSQKFMISLEDYTCEDEQPQNDHLQKLLDSSEGCDYVQEQIEDKTSYVFSVDQKQVKHEYIGEPSKPLVFEGVNQKNDEQYVDATDNFDLDLGTFFESDDLMNPLDVDTSFDMLEEYLSFSDANDGMSDYLTFDPPLIGGCEDLISAELPTSQDVIEKTQPVVSSELPLEHLDITSSSKQTKYGTDFQQHPFIKQASQMLMGNVHAPPAFASEFPSQYLKTGSPHASSSVHFTAGMIQIRNPSQTSRGSDMFHGKDGLCNITLSFGMSRGDDNSTTLESVVRILPGKAVSALFGGGSFYFMLLSILVLSLSCKLGSFIFAQ